MIARLAMMYKKILEYLEHQISTERDYLYKTTPENLRTMVKKVLAYEKTLNGFTK